MRHETGGTFHRFQRNVAGETIRHDDVGLPREDLVTFDESDIVQPARLEQRRRFLDRVMALRRFHADIQ